MKSIINLCGIKENEIRNLVIKHNVTCFRTLLKVLIKFMGCEVRECIHRHAIYKSLIRTFKYKGLFT